MKEEGGREGGSEGVGEWEREREGEPMSEEGEKKKHCNNKYTWASQVLVTCLPHSFHQRQHCAASLMLYERKQQSVWSKINPSFTQFQALFSKKRQSGIETNSTTWYNMAQYSFKGLTLTHKKGYGYTATIAPVLNPGFLLAPEACERLISRIEVWLMDPRLHLETPVPVLC